MKIDFNHHIIEGAERRLVPARLGLIVVVILHVLLSKAGRNGEKGGEDRARNAWILQRSLLQVLRCRSQYVRCPVMLAEVFASLFWQLRSGEGEGESMSQPRGA